MKKNFKALGIKVAPRGNSKGSTDVGNVSHVVPTIQAYVGIDVNALHTPEFRDAAISAKGDEAVINGAKVMALTALDVLMTILFTPGYAKPLKQAEVTERFIDLNNLDR